MNLFLDTCALVKLYRSETGSQSLLNFLQQYEKDLVLTIADIAIIEFHSAFMKSVRTGMEKVETAHSSIANFTGDLEAFNIIETDKAVNILAISLLKSIAATRGLRTLDALQLATAIIANWIYPVDCFITADTVLFGVAKDFFKVFNPDTPSSWEGQNR